MARFLGLGNGSDGVINLSSYTPLSYSCSGSSGSYSLTATGSFSAGQRLFIIQSRGSGVGEYEDNQVVSYSPGTVSLLFPLEHTYTDSGASQAQVIIVKQASGVNGSITVPAWNGDVGGVFVMACNGIFNGSVNASGSGYRGASAIDPWLDAQRADGKHGEGYQGTNYNVDATVAYVSNAGSGGGGAYNNNADAGSGGGGGGHATAGTNGNIGHSTNGSGPGGGGGTVGVANLTSLYFGGGGGSGSTAYNTDENGGVHSGAGGNGGGIIVVYAGSFSSSASLVASGNNGGSASSADAGYAGGGGGGAGGSILIKGRSVAVGTSKILAGAGDRGSGGDMVFNSWGGYGGVGRIRIEACSLSGTTNPGASTAIGGHNYCGVLAGMI